MLIGSLALGGFPFLSGFYSKDFILELAYAKFKIHGLFAFTLGTLSAFLTAFYSSRLLYLTFGGNSSAFRYNMTKIHEGNYQLTLPLLSLIFGSLFSGFFLKDFFVGFGSTFFSNSIFVLASNSILFDIEFIPLIIKIIPTLVGLSGFVLAFFIYQSSMSPLMYLVTIRIYTFFNTKWFFDHIYNLYIGKFIF